MKRFLFHLIFIQNIVVELLFAQTNFNYDGELNLFSGNDLLKLNGVIEKNLLQYDNYKISGDVHLIDSIEVFYNHGYLSKIKCMYNENKRIYSYVSYSEFLDGWRETWKTEFFYDKLRRNYKLVEKSHNGVEWENFLQFQNYYDEKNNVILKIIQRWSNMEWVNLYYDSLMYDSNNRLVTVENFDWDNYKWIKKDKDSMIYNSKNQMITKVWSKWDGDKWDNFFKWNYDYEKKGKNDTIHVYNWNGIDWNYIAKTIYNWQNNYTWLTATVNLLQNSKWVEIERWTDYYNSANYLLETFFERNEYGSWVPADGRASLRNPDGFEIHFLAEGMIVYYGNPPIVGVEEPVETQLPTNFILEQNYPNPFNPRTMINYTTPSSEFGKQKSENVLLSVYDILGNEVATLVNENQSPGTYSVEWNTANQPSGVFFYTLRYGDKSTIKKMVLLR